MEEQQVEELIKIKCSHCNYEWETKSKLKMVSCPSCLNKVSIDNNKKGEEDGTTNKEI